MNLYFLYIVEVWQICENINIKDPIGKCAKDQGQKEMQLVANQDQMSHLPCNQRAENKIIKIIKLYTY